MFVAPLFVSAAVAPWVTIGTGKSQARLTDTESVLFEHNVSDGTGVLNHFWAAGSSSVDNTTFRYYVDGETTPSLVFTPALACGVGFGDQAAPWGTKWIGKGATSTGWFHNIQVPFKTVRITYQKRADEPVGTIWMIVRGLENVPVRVGAIELPTTARLKLQVTRKTLQPLEFVDIVDVPSPSSGLIFLHSMAVSSGNYNFMEGCYHLMTPSAAAWPGQLLSTGMEDYFDSAFYFNGGTFHAPNAGSTHMAPGQWSGYRTHEMDPLVFHDGARMRWRNGDVTDEQTGLKCTLESGGKTVGAPTASNVTAYAWVYVW